MHLEIVKHGLELYTFPLAALDRIFPREDGAYIIRMFGHWSVRFLPDLPKTIRNGEYIEVHFPQLVNTAPNCYFDEDSAYIQCVLIFEEFRDNYRNQGRTSDRLLGNLYGKSLFSYENQVRQPFNDVDYALWRITDHRRIMR